MNQKTYVQVSGWIFVVIAIMHAMRIVLGWQVVVAGWDVPLLVSIAAAVVGGYLAYISFTLKK